METIKNICLGVIYGFWDSISGMTLLFHIDAEIHRLKAEKEAERQQRRLEHERLMNRRSPSPTPSSAAAMARADREQALLEVENPDERNITSMSKKTKVVAEQTPQGEKKIAKQVLKCCLLNGGFTWLSIVFFEQLLLPTLKLVLTFCYGKQSQDLHMIWGWLQSILSIIFGMMWVMPIYLLSKIVSSLWFADIANAAYRIRKGRPQMIPSISKLVADFLFSILVQMLFLGQSMLVNKMPVRYVGETLYFLHMCMLYSLYSFEYKWFNMGWELHRRLNYIENNWPYFIGFGIPLTVLTSLSSSLIVSSCIFSIFFPLFILSGNEAKPLVGATEIPMRLFSPVIFFSNLFFNRSNKAGGGNSATRAQKLTANKMTPQQLLLFQQWQQQQLQQQQQQQMQAARRRSSQQRETKEPSPFRYQQPPPFQPQLQTTLRSRNSSPERLLGKTPLIPTPVVTPKAASTAAHAAHDIFGQR